MSGRAYEKQKRTEAAVDTLRARLHAADQTATGTEAENGQQQPAAEQPQPGAA